MSRKIFLPHPVHICHRILSSLSPEYFQKLVYFSPHWQQQAQFSSPSLPCFILGLHSPRQHGHHHLVLAFVAQEADLTLSCLSFKTQHTRHLMALEIWPLRHTQHYLSPTPTHLTNTWADWASWGSALHGTLFSHSSSISTVSFSYLSFSESHHSAMLLILSRVTSLSQAENAPSVLLPVLKFEHNHATMCF